MSIMLNFPFYLSCDDWLDVCIPDVPMYEADEVEVWLQRRDSKICLFKDSFRYTLSVEVSHVIKNFSLCNQKERYVSSDLMKKYFNDFLNGGIEDELWEYELFSYRKNISFLSEDFAGSLTLSIAEMDFISITPTCKEVASYIIDHTQILGWFECVLKRLSEIFAE